MSAPRTGGIQRCNDRTSMIGVETGHGTNYVASEWSAIRSRFHYIWILGLGKLALQILNYDPLFQIQMYAQHIP